MKNTPTKSTTNQTSKASETGKLNTQYHGHGLMALGWDPTHAPCPDQAPGCGNIIARVTGVRKNRFLVHDGESEHLATARGKLYQAGTNDLFPATGDWVLMNEGQIASVLPRKNALARGASGQQGKKESGAVKNQVIATNLDRVFIVCGLDRDFSPRRIERYLTLVYNCGCTPVVLLTKADLHADPTSFVSETESVAFGVPVHAISAINKEGMAPLAPYLEPGSTVALIGSSGAGKSTLVNTLSGKEIQATKEVSHAVGKGVHTTTTRDLIRLPGGALLIDNPGIREIAFWDTDDNAQSTFPEIDALSEMCRFSDCTHTNEPGCRVLEACKNGDVSRERLASYTKQKRELDYLALRETKSADRLEKERWKWVSLEMKQMKKSGKMQK